MFNFAQYSVLSFDCYGTLVDWEKGITTAIRPILANAGIVMEDEEILRQYAVIEAELEAQEYQSYRQILCSIMRRLLQKWQIPASKRELAVLADSVSNWPVFPDTVASLQILQKHYQLAIFSNIDDDIIQYAVRQHIQSEFTWIVTAQQARAYKPSQEMFRIALNKVGKTKSEILHVAQSLYHDIVPANELGLSTVWINRRHDNPGFGATPPASARPDCEFPDLMSMVKAMGIH